ncbi:DUF2381 family protein [Archangium gephyra]|nr:DUF2381 family protein [Archangium gephyra]
MFIPLPAASLLLVLLASTPTNAQPASEAWEAGEDRRVELTADNAGQAHPVYISPNRLTGFIFHAPLQRGGVVVEERERFRSVTVDETAGLVTLLPSGALSPERELLLTVRFADGEVPEWATFRLVVHPTRAERQVEVYRQSRSAESYQRGERQQRERAEQCEARLAEAERPRPWGITSLFEAGLLGMGKLVAVKRLVQDMTQRSGEILQVQAAWSYRAEGRVVVELLVLNTDTLPWTVEGVEGVEWVSADGTRLRVLRVWQPLPLTPGGTRQIVVEAEATTKQMEETFVLKLGEAGGPRTLIVRGVTFP